MARNRFERVGEVQPDALTLSLTKQNEQEVGVVIFPASASNGRFSEDKVSDPLPPRDSFRSAVRLANEVKLAIVVLDPDGIWNPEWGDLYSSTES
jgi:hypothetical protein